MKEAPSFMADAAQQHLAQSMRQNPELWIAAARFASVGPNVGDRLATIMAALELSEIKSLPEWLSAMTTYDGVALKRGGDDRVSNPDLPSNAFYLCEAILRLLQLVEAPSALSSDLQWLLKSKMPIKAEKRAKVQGLLISSPEMSRKKMADAAGCSLKMIQKDIDGGVLVRLPPGVDP